MSKKITDLDAIGSLSLTDVLEVVDDPGGSPLSRKGTMQQVADIVSTDTDIADAISKKHTQNTDTALGTMAANVNMNSHKLTGLAVPSSNGDSIRATAKITEALLESATDLKHDAATVAAAPLTLSGQQITMNYDTDRMELSGNNLRNKTAVYTDIDTGTDTNKTVTADALNHSIHGIKRVILKITDDDTELTVADGVLIITVPPEWNGMNVVDFDIAISTVSSSGAVSVQLRNVTDSHDILSTNATIDASEYSSYTAATAPAINASYDDLATGDRLAIDVDGAGTGAKGLEIHLGMRKP